MSEVIESVSRYALYDSDRDMVARLYDLTSELLRPSLSPLMLFRIAKLQLALARLPHTTEEANLRLTFSRESGGESSHYSLLLGFEDFLLDYMHTSYDPEFGGDHYSADYFMANTTGSRREEDVHEWFWQVETLLADNPRCWDIADDFEGDNAAIDWHAEYSGTLLNILPEPDQSVLRKAEHSAPVITLEEWDRMDRGVCPKCGSKLPQVKSSPCTKCSATLHLHDAFTLEIPADSHIYRPKG